MADINEINNELTAGQMLKHARTTGRRKRELTTISRLLCVKEDFLNALENDEFEKIGELVYILGFARNYAMELELDPYVIVEKIKKQMGLVEEDDEIEIEGESPVNLHQEIKEPSKIANWIRKNIRIIIITTASILGVIVIGSAIINIIGKPSEEAVEIGGTKYNLPVNHEYGTRNKDYAAVVLQATDATWVQIKNPTGAIVFEHTLVTGDVYYALNGTVATVGNAGALDVWVNGKVVSKLGGDHQRIQDVVLSAENLVKPDQQNK